ncbi:sigma 54-interacting transcriptional regulator [Dyadobacter subterraneus]|uniref:Sigma 54-interacting transcriptional regulator n=1 Tax=Dyadobacter subterraneus TaxID=2773304 RepID=A0ABR9W7K4_9BACT|nr:sigma 54-interacting response regulator [Dyadobacter subterraneus]MBE9461435.1 sigma 54-interacting transcriptional regulator [Dyadobacter subterraneus]
MNQKILIVEDQFIEANHLRLMLQRAGYGVCGIARSVDQAEELVESEKPTMVLLDIFLTGKRTGIELAEKLRDSNIPFIYLSANSNEEVLNAAKATHPNGFLVKPFREKDLLVALQIAEYHHENGLESKLRKESFFQKQLTAIHSEKAGWEQKLLKVAQALQPLIPFDYMVAGYSGEGKFMPNNALFFLRIGFNEYQVTGVEGLQVVANLKKDELVSMQAKTVVGTEVTFFNGAPFKKLCSIPTMRKIIADTFHMNAVLTLPLPGISDDGKIFFISFYSRRNDTYTDEHAALCNRMQSILTRAIQNMLKVEMVPPSEADIALPEMPMQSQSTRIFDGIVGQSHLLLHVFDLINQVAPGDTSVLITGESGTGKERIADSIHALSGRKGKPFIKVNCAALPVNLIESELFGHEKGAFTGAVERRIGRFEQADGGTIFLDEIGDMPLEMQVKLLRVLQEKEIERIGGKSTVKVNIRVIAATNRNLEKEVAEGRFRLDLYYRLNVFPLQLPSLSERKEDIPLLVNHFIRYYSRKTGRKISGVSDRVMKNLLTYDWPGNIRELENLIERSVLLTKGFVIEEVTLPLSKNKKPASQEEDGRMKTIFENERDHIIAVLKKCNGRIRGAFGAAEILDIPPTTLGSKMKKLGIRREFVS